MATLSAFSPNNSFTIAAVAATAVEAQLKGSGETVVVQNPTNGVIFARFGADNTVAATVNDTPILPGARAIMDIGHNGGAPVFLSVFLSAGATGGNVYATRGNGSFF